VVVLEMVAQAVVEQVMVVPQELQTQVAVVAVQVIVFQAKLVVLVLSLLKNLQLLIYKTLLVFGVCKRFILL
jgi:hypothetical protein